MILLKFVEASNKFAVEWGKWKKLEGNRKYCEVEEAQLDNL
jgi:hypothetical protein